MMGPLAVLITAFAGVLLVFATSPGAQSQTVTPSQSTALVSIDGADLGEFRDASGSHDLPLKITGTNEYTNVTLKRGVVSGSSLYDWYNSKSVKTGAIKIQQVGKPPVIYHLSNCRPVKYEGPTLSHSTGNDIAIEELVLSCEHITLVK